MSCGSRSCHDAAGPRHILWWDSADTDKGSLRDSCGMPKTGGSKCSLLKFLACTPVANLAMKQQVNEEQGSSNNDSCRPSHSSC